MSGSQDSGTCVFDYKPDGDDDGFIDDFVQERSSEVYYLMCSLFTSLSERGILEVFGDLNFVRDHVF